MARILLQREEPAALAPDTWESTTMLGNMMQQPLLISSILQQAKTLAPRAEIVSRRIEGDTHRYSYLDCHRRTCQLAQALRTLGVSSGDRIGTLAWNGYRHIELYYAISGIGAIVHTVNPRLFTQQIEYIVNHAEDSLLFVDLTFVPLLNELVGRIPSVRTIVLLCARADAPVDTRFEFLCYEELIAGLADEFAWPDFDEDTAACLCYTSGTTGDPKGVLYSHRSTVLHALASCVPNGLNLSRQSVVLPVVPMYHVSAWGLPYSCLMAGAKLVLPGARMDGQSLFELIERERVSLALGVPTVWQTMLQQLEKTGQKLPRDMTFGVGGAAAPLALVEKLREHDAYLMPLWGMTETSPLATFGGWSEELQELPPAARNRWQTSAGRAIYGIEIEIFDDDEQPLPHDGAQSGQLRTRGPWVVRNYYRNDCEPCVGGWFDTGDVATIDADGFLRIVDRKKDVIKSGGEWISSIALENAAVSHACVREACVVGVPHPRWDERPLLLVVLNEGRVLDKDSILEHLATRVAKWWLPNDIVALDELPHTATGKLHKVPLRDRFRNHFTQT
jgi:3-(methylthio)propionyl---CoA ligase